jgi:hypothetical protein
VTGILFFLSMGFDWNAITAELLATACCMPCASLVSRLPVCHYDIIALVLSFDRVPRDRIRSNKVALCASIIAPVLKRRDA